MARIGFLTSFRCQIHSGACSHAAISEQSSAPRRRVRVRVGVGGKAAVARGVTGMRSRHGTCSKNKRNASLINQHLNEIKLNQNKLYSIKTK